MKRGNSPPLTPEQADLVARLAHAAARVAAMPRHRHRADEVYDLAVNALVEAARLWRPEKSSWRTYAMNKVRSGVLGVYRRGPDGGLRDRRAAFRRATASLDRAAFAATPRSEADPDGMEELLLLVRRAAGRKAEAACRLHFIGGLTLAETGRAMGMSEARAQQLTNGLAKNERVRRLLAARGYGPKGVAV